MIFVRRSPFPTDRAQLAQWRGDAVRAGHTGLDLELVVGAAVSTATARWETSPELRALAERRARVAPELAFHTEWAARHEGWPAAASLGPPSTVLYVHHRLWAAHHRRVAARRARDLARLEQQCERRALELKAHLEALRAVLRNAHQLGRALARLSGDADEGSTRSTRSPRPPMPTTMVQMLPGSSGTNGPAITTTP